MGKGVEGRDDIKVNELPGGKAATMVHIGPLNELRHAHKALQDYVLKNDLKPAGGLWESMEIEPGSGRNPKEYKTKLYLPLAKEE